MTQIVEGSLRCKSRFVWVTAQKVGEPPRIRRDLEVLDPEIEKEEEECYQRRTWRMCRAA